MRSTFIFAALLFLYSCATTNENDPLKNTKKLIKQGHASLYENGAFNVPKTTIKLIPPGPDTVDFACSLVGIKARDSFLLSIKNAASSYNLVKAGTLKSFKLAKKIHYQTNKMSKGITNQVKDNSWFLIKKSVAFPKKAVIKSIALTKKTNQELLELAKKIDLATEKAGKELRKDILYNGYLNAELIESWGKKSDKNLSQEGDKFAEKMGSFQEIIKSGAKIDHDITNSGKTIEQNSKSIGKEIYQNSKKAGLNSKNTLSKMGDQSHRKLIEVAQIINKKTTQRASSHFNFAKRKFIQGYVAVPKNIKKRGNDITNTLSDFSKRFKATKELKKKYSKKTGYLFSKTLATWDNDLKKSLKAAKNEFSDNSQIIGHTLSSIKALAWLTKALLWDVSIKPLGKATAAGLGYLSVNTIAYPTMLVVQEGIATTKMAVEVVKATGNTTYDLIAPTAIASVAGIFSLLEYTGGKITAGTSYALAPATKYPLKGFGYGVDGFIKGVGKSTELITHGLGKLYKGGSYLFGKAARGIVYAFAPVATTGTYLTKHTIKASGKLIKGSSNLASKTWKGGSWAGANMVQATSYLAGKATSNSIRYIGVPLASVGIPTVGTSAGVAVGASGIAAGSSYYLAGQTVAGGTYVFGNTLSGATLATGTAISTATGTALSVYEMIKGTIVPASYTLGSGIVLTYGTLIHLTAQSILAVSDASYLVLSMEGPRWVIYAIKGKLGNGNDLPGGTILNLEEMKKNGEEFMVVPTSKTEIENVIESVQQGTP